MPAATVAPGSGQPGSAAGTVPFLMATHPYGEKFDTTTQLLDANSHEVVKNITPGGFLRAIRLTASSTGGVAGTLTADAPWSMFSNITLENIDGSPILYPMNGYAYYVASKYFYPWLGDPNKQVGYNTAIATPGASLLLSPEIRNTAGVLSNTDARATYRIRYTLAPVTSLGTGYTTAPTVSVAAATEIYSQTDPTDLHGNSVQALPDGLAIAHLIRHQIVTLNSSGADNTIQLANTGNELRAIAFIIRDSSGTRQDYFSDPVRIRLDDRSLGVLSPTEIAQRMTQFYPFLANGTSTRETGVYVIPRFRNPGTMDGVYWLPTSNATYLTIESTSSGGTGGTVEVITDEVVPVGPVPSDLEGI